jgi:hypothetical protein
MVDNGHAPTPDAPTSGEGGESPRREYMELMPTQPLGSRPETGYWQELLRHKAAETIVARGQAGFASLTGRSVRNSRAGRWEPSKVQNSGERMLVQKPPTTAVPLEKR